MMGIALQLDIEQVNYMLEHQAKYHSLYPKNIDDGIYIYMIKNKCWTPNLKISIQEIFDDYKKTANNMISHRKKIQNPLETFILWKNIRKTFLQSNNLGFEDYMEILLDNIDKGHKELIECIENLLYIQKVNVTALCTTTGNGSQIYARQIRNLKNKGTIPSREFLIVLGIKLELSVDGIDKLLDLAGMIPLYSRDSLESYIRHCIETLMVESPNSFFDLEHNTALPDNILLEEYMFEKLNTKKDIFKSNKEYKKIMKLL